MHAAAPVLNFAISNEGRRRSTYGSREGRCRVTPSSKDWSQFVKTLTYRSMMDEEENKGKGQSTANFSFR